GPLSNISSKRVTNQFLVNFRFGLLAGTAVLAVGLWLRFDSRTKDIFDHEENDTTFYTVNCSLCFHSCCNAFCETSALCLGTLKPCLTFFTFLLVIFGLEVAAAIWGFANKSMVADNVKNFYDSVYKKRSEPSAKETLRALQHALNCCGYTGAIEAAFLDTCPKQDLSEMLKLQSCHAAIDDFFTTKLNVIGAVGIVVGVVMIFGMIFSMILCCAVRRSREMI
uniref:Tetraspanin n=1 Tax=Anolis carolinensis TaxID=28377 RepID=G1KA93_ANOCA